MKKYRNIFFYVIVTGLFGLLMYLIVMQGKVLEIGRAIHYPTTAESTHWSEFLSTISDNFVHPLAILLAQIVTIIFFARIFGWICKKIGQPTVIGEIIAGIVLGPSVIGLYYPEAFKVLFPPESLGNLHFLSQIGLILFMFMVGMELDLKTVKNRASDAVVISHASIIFPFTLGLGLAYLLYSEFAPQGVQFLSFGLFIGIAMSITAFPVLARIVQERGIHKTKLGALVITCAAIDDITAWCVLAGVIAIVKAGSILSSLYTIVASIAYVLVMIKVVQPFLKRVGDLHPTRENMNKQVVAIFFITLIISSYTTEIIGIHALFGAFLAGTIMPNNMKFRNIFIEKVEDVALVLLLPLFFVLTGLRTEIGLINDINLWKITGLIILVAVTGKFLGGALSAKFVGLNWHDSLSIGALMNTRGLMQLVVLSIGYDLGVLTPAVFAMMIIMAIVTTIMTGPALDVIKKIFKNQGEENEFSIDDSLSKYRILISYANPDRGKILLRLANSFVKKSNSNSTVTVMHLSSNSELSQINIDEYEHDSFDPLIQESKELNQKITTLFKVSNDIYGDISEVANKGDYDLLMVGLGQSIFEGSLLGRILGFTTKIIDPDKLLNSVTGRGKLFERSPFEESTRLILAKTEVPVGIFIEKNFTKLDTVLVPIFNANDAFLVRYAQKLINNSGAMVTILDASGNISESPSMKEPLRIIEQSVPDHLQLIAQTEITSEMLDKNDLMLISLESWKRLVETQHLWLVKSPSTLIIRD